MTKILAFSGKKQSGKSTSSNFVHGYQLRAFRVINNFALTEFGDLLISSGDDDSYGQLDVNRADPPFAEWAEYNMWPYVKKYSLATPLKVMAIELFGINYEQVFGTEAQKNTKTHLRWEDMPMSIAERKRRKKSGKMTAREFLQFFGTEVCRRVHDDIWAERLIKDIEIESSLLAVVDDVRFKNEVDLIKGAGGKVIRLTRQPHSDDHASETELDEYEGFDATIDNTDLTINETNQQIIQLLEEWGWLGEEVLLEEKKQERLTGIQAIRS
jgi:hypothetical protein